MKILGVSYVFIYIISIFARKNRIMWKEMSDPAILERIGKRIRNTRIRQELTQEELAKLSGISVLTLINIEKGKSVSMVLFISVMRTLGLLENLELLVPEIKISPVVLKKLQGKTRYRVRHKTKNDE